MYTHRRFEGENCVVVVDNVDTSHGTQSILTE